MADELDNAADYESDDDIGQHRYLTFNVDGEDYGMEIIHIKEIVGVQKITEVPDMPAYVRGVINLRGQVIPVTDVRMRFQMTQRDYDDRTCIIVVDSNETLVGLIVDRVKEVLDIPESQVEPRPRVAKASSHKYIRGLGKVGDDVKILLDVQKLLFEDTNLAHLMAA